MDKALLEALVRRAGLDKALAAFPEDVAAAADQASGHREEFAAPVSPAAEPWPPMRPGQGHEPPMRPGQGHEPPMRPGQGHEPPMRPGQGQGPVMRRAGGGE